MKISKLILGTTAILIFINPVYVEAKGGFLRGLAKLFGAKEGSVMMDLADVGDQIGNAVVAKKTNDALNKYGGEQIDSYNQWVQQYNDNQDRKVQSYLSEVDKYKMDYCKAHGFYDLWQSRYGDQWYELAGKAWFDAQNDLSRRRTGDEILPWHLREDRQEVEDRANALKVKESSLAGVVLNAINLSTADVERAEQWISSDKFGKRDMIIDEAFNIVGNHSSNREMVDAFRRMTKANNEYLRNKANGDKIIEIAVPDPDAEEFVRHVSGKASTMALTKMTLDLQDVVFDAYKNAKEKKKEYLAQKLNIKDQLIASGYEGDSQLAMEVAGTILSIQNNKDLNEHEKREWLRLLGYYGNEEMVEQIAEQVDAMDDATIDNLLAESKEPSVDNSIIEAQKKAEQEALEKENLIESINKLSIDSYLFDETILTDEQKNTLNAVFDVLKKYSDLRIKIIGHTCNIGYKSVNERVGLRRANEAKQYLVDRGIDTDRITIESKGELEPLVDNHSITNRKLNRRLVFVINK